MAINKIDQTIEELPDKAATFQDQIDAEIRKAAKIIAAGQTRKSTLSSQVGGNHYAKFGEYQPWQVLAKWLTPEELKGYMKGTVIAYLAREDDKGKRQDIEKALHTIQLYLEVSK